ncbi:MAG: hypothetical protein BGO78_06460 [Chloroflexi bacterium 44-23]|nr:MAG: hypothetical protein BGO78_06460 [Chloroflexi bacterium 44-23]
MRFGVKSIWTVIKDFYYQLTKMVVLNLLWLLCCIPIITIPAATGALAYATHVLIADESEYNWKLFFSGFKKTFWWIWRWFLPNLLIPLIFLTNIFLFQSENGTLNLIVRAGNILLLFGWSFLQTFTLPVLFEQKKPQIFMALRNSFAVFVHLPAYFLMTFLFFWTIMLISTILVIPLLVVTISFGMFFSMSMLKLALQEMKAQT